MHYSWKNVICGGGGFVPGIIFHPSCKGLCYLRTDMGGAYRRNDSGQAWQCITDMFGKDEAQYNGVLSLAVDANDPERVYMMNGKYTGKGHGKGAFHASRDRGTTWKKTALPFKVGGNEKGRGAGERLAVDPNMGAIIFMGTGRNGLWRSDTCGERWHRIRTFLPKDVNFVVFHATSGSHEKATRTIFAAAAQQGRSLYRSDDCGMNWQPVRGQPRGVMAIRASMAGTDMYITFSDTPGPFGAKSGGVWKYDIINGSMSELKLPAGSCGYSGVSADPQKPGRLVVSTLNRTEPYDEIYISDDGGGKWEPLIGKSEWDNSYAGYTKTMTPHWISDIEIDPFDSSRAVFTTGYGIWTSRELSLEKASWFFDDRGLEETVAVKLISPAQGAHIVSAMGDIDGFSHDGLDTAPANRHDPWRATTLSMDNAGLKPLFFVKSYNHRQPYGAYSDDGAVSWKDFSACPEGAARGGVRSMAVSADGGTILWEPEGARMSWSDDNGATWHKSEGGFEKKLWPVSDRSNPDVFYMYDGVKGVIWVSTDRGRKFRRGAGWLKAAGCYPGGDGMADFELCSVPQGKGELWLAAGKKGLYRSVDYGRSVKKIKGVKEAFRAGFGRNTEGALYPAVFIWGTVGSTTGIFRSPDCGATWQRINDDKHQYGWIHCVTGDARVFGRCYLGTEGRGVLYGEELPDKLIINN
ncbi:MAG: endoglucanase [Spirochaetia bacterium]|nr:endoglucanase [Spirochaetia bacterium]